MNTAKAIHTALDWSALSEEQRRLALRRPAQRNSAELHERVQAIIDAVRTRGDAAIQEFSERFDRVKLSALQVSEQEFAAAAQSLNSEQRAALERDTYPGLCTA